MAFVVLSLLEFSLVNVAIEYATWVTAQVLKE